MKPAIIAPSILSADLTKLGAEVSAVLAAGADWIHIDVMDNHYVPNLTFGPVICQSLRQAGFTAPLDIHLMVQPVDQLIHAFAKAGASSITFHPEASLHVDRSLQLIRDLGCVPGIVLNPATPLGVLDYIWDKIDMILMMSVNPGFAGQTFIPGILKKISAVHTLIQQQTHPIRLAVDGGISLENLSTVHAAGADTFIMGSAVFNSPNYVTTLQRARQLLTC